MDEHDADDASPIEHQLEVAVSRTRAWDAYVHGLDEWWHPGWTVTGSGLDRVVVEQRDGLRIVEHARDGREIVWGEVTEAVTGERFAHTFRPTPEGDATMVLVTFVDLPQGGTRVHLTHSGWNATNQRGRAQHADWPRALERYRAYVQHV